MLIIWKEILHSIWQTQQYNDVRKETCVIKESSRVTDDPLEIPQGTQNWPTTVKDFLFRKCRRGIFMQGQQHTCHRGETCRVFKIEVVRVLIDPFEKSIPDICPLSTFYQLSGKLWFQFIDLGAR
jgi:hypothetical protein